MIRDNVKNDLLINPDLLKDPQLPSNFENNANIS